MACTLNSGRLVDCKDQIGGLKKIYFVSDYCSDIRGQATIADDEMTAGGFANWDIASGSPATVTVYQYDLRPDLSSLTVNVNSDAATGTTTYEQTLSVTLQKLSKADNKELRLIAQNRVQVFVLDNNDNLFLLGIDHGLDVTGGTIVTGAARTDMTGYTLEFSGREVESMIWLPASAGNGTAKYPFDGLSDEDGLTITTGV